ncbi:MAG: condensation domain-containing protein, partial [Bacteroidota bacterium]
MLCFPIAGREDVMLENQIGFFVNVIPLRTVLQYNESFKNLLEKVKHNMSTAYQYQSYPFDVLIDDLNL